MPPTIDDPAGLARDLCRWYREGHRSLPWRKTRDPYHIWLSEIMLQQTQVKTVIPYYERFLRQFPTIEALANASDDTVLKAWEGLGYYARCRNLIKAARLVAREHAGEFPRTREAVEALPGIGRSTAGAILSFSFDQRLAILDANVKRVLCRLVDLHEDPSGSRSARLLWSLSESLVEAASHAGELNQALLELGQALCRTRAPRCLVCPVSTHCAARAAGTQDELPIRRARKPLPHYTIAVGVIEDDGRVLIQKRPDEGLLGGLWEFPGGKQEPGEALPDTVRREISEELGIEVEVGEEITKVRHAYTHFRITLHAYRCRHLRGAPKPRAATAWRWVPESELDRYPFPKANKAILSALGVSP